MGAIISTPRELPILMSGPMVRRVLDGSKTQTRRVLDPQPPAWCETFGFSALTPPRHAGGRGWTELNGERRYGEHVFKLRWWNRDRLWLKETWAVGKCADGLAPRELASKTWLHDNGGLWYPADNTEPKHPISPRGKTRVSIHMVRWASRITLEVTSLKVERLQDITEADIIAEGVTVDRVAEWTNTRWSDMPTLHHAWAVLWDSINGNRPGFAWKDNPVVAAISFKRLETAKT